MSRPAACHRRGRRVGDVHERDADRCLHLLGDDVHRVRRDDEQLGARSLERARVGREPLAERVPAAALLQRLDLGEVVAAHDQVGRVGRAEPLANGLVHDALVLDR